MPSRPKGPQSGIPSVGCSAPRSPRWNTMRKTVSSGGPLGLCNRRKQPHVPHRLPPPGADAGGDGHAPAAAPRPCPSARPAQTARAARRPSGQPPSACPRPRHADAAWSRTRPGCARAPRPHPRPSPHPPMAPDRRAPAACWWARTTVASTKCRSQSRSPRASAFACRRCSTRSNTPALRQR
jgi:hypothetical protein